MRIHSRRYTFSWEIPLTVLVCSFACRNESPSPPVKELEITPPTPITINPQEKDLLFTFRDPTTDKFQTVSSVTEVPEACRRTVVITPLNLPPDARGAGQYVHVADLTTLDGDGNVRTAVASRYGLDRGILTSTVGETLPSSSAPPVVVYSASWCGVCKKTKRLLQQLGVRFEERDIEASRSAREELAAKAQAAGIQPGGVPVIDVQGRLMQGLDEERLLAWLKEAGLIKDGSS